MEKIMKTRFNRPLFLFLTFFTIFLYLPFLDTYMMGAEYTFNSNDGYFEGLVRGFRAGIITQEDYTNLTQCETLEGEKKKKKEVDFFQHHFINEGWGGGGGGLRLPSIPVGSVLVVCFACVATAHRASSRATASLACTCVRAFFFFFVLG